MSTTTTLRVVYVDGSTASCELILSERSLIPIVQREAAQRWDVVAAFVNDQAVYPNEGQLDALRNLVRIAENDVRHAEAQLAEARRDGMYVAAYCAHLRRAVRDGAQARLDATERALGLHQDATIATATVGGV